MCVIIVRNPGIEIPFSKIDSACTVNSDGFGLSVVDRGRIETVKMYDPKGNDPEAVYKALEDAKDHRVYLHLRYATKGGKSNDNCHPFDVYNDDEYHVQFMHNGTLGMFGSEVQTDSEDFATRILRPLIRRTLLETDNPLDDAFAKAIITQYAGSSNRFVLFDNNGKDLIHGSKGESNWHDNDGWWSSNVYSFNRTHRTVGSGKSYYYGGVEKKEDPFYFPKLGQTNASATAPKTTTPTTSTATGATSEPKALTSDIFPRREKVDPVPCEEFCELAGLNGLHEVCEFDKETIMDILDDKDIAYCLLRDLIFELYERQFEDGNGE